MASVWGELKRRNVVKVAVAYAIVGWLLIEVSTTVLPVFEAPDWIAQVFTFFILLGFPLALILSWAYEITPEGIKLERNITAGESITHVTGRKLDFVIIGLLVLAVGYMFVGNYLPESGPFAGAEIDPASLEVELDEPPSIAVEPAPAIAEEEQREVLPNSVAVLPFENLSPDPDNEYYAAGIHEEILNHLVKLSALNVIARTSVQQTATTEKSIPEIARELNVETVMEGSVRYDSGRIRITAQLNDGVTGAHLWSETYTRDFEDIFAIESDVAMNVANALEAEFSLEEQASIERVPTDSPEAYRLYLRARLVVDNASAYEYLSQAIEADPNFALAYTYRASRSAGSLARDTATQENFEARRLERERSALLDIDKALELDPTSGQAYSALAQIHEYNWRGIDARDAHEKAYRASPNDPFVLAAYARFNSYTGRYKEAVSLVQRAVALDPNNIEVLISLGTVLEFAGALDEASDAHRGALEINPNDSRAQTHYGLLQLRLGNNAEAERELRLADRLTFGESVPVMLVQVAYGYSRLGLSDDTDRLLSRFEDVSRNRRTSATHQLLASLTREDEDSALDWLTVIAEKEPYEAYILVHRIEANAFGDPVLDRPAFVRLREQLGFTDL